jgi:hypothetical protein
MINLKLMSKLHGLTSNTSNHGLMRMNPIIERLIKSYYGMMFLP